MIFSQRKKIIFTSVVAIMLTLFTAPTSARSGETVYTVNYPLSYFAERIAGDFASVIFPVPTGIDPAFWQPSRKDIRDFQRSNLILLNGANYAKWVKHVSLPKLRSIDTSASFKDQLITVSSDISHSHGSGYEHAHSGLAFTTWLDLSQAALQAKSIAVAMKKILPEQERKIENNFQLLESELLNFDLQLTEIVASNPDLPVIGSHPVYQYLARRYDIKMQSVFWEPDEIPDNEQWQSLEFMLESHPAQWMIWEALPDPKTVARLKQFGITSLVFSPIGNKPKEGGDFKSVMEYNIENLRAAYDKSIPVVKPVE